MNFIAHIHLSGTDEAIIAGNYMSDLISLKVAKALPEDVYRGVLLHRAIDGYTDAHPLYRSCTKLLHDMHSKYAPILVDIYFDHLLQRHWARFSSAPIESTLERAYQALNKHRSSFDPSGEAYIARLLDRRWLIRAYRDRVGLETTFGYLKDKVSRPERLDGVVDNLISLDEKLEEAFLAFYPQLMAEAAAIRNSQE